ncbi:hypothetical protein [Aurantimonas sp. 22II-16-19i]|uniref:hypothetical protein n=1 Tax=Aurantimonas sp. 22II-16-19i TaxID=1317114 RepID=UPI00111BF4FF|nr:hypothetical protein [Aurantimonas sp. 22II-16-19i]
MVHLDILLKIIQIAFYVVAAVIAIMTYIKAKNGLLNAVNTEYQKRVIERLSNISEELFAEFDIASEDSWANDNIADIIFSSVNEEALRNKHEIITNKMTISGYQIPQKFLNMRSQITRFEFDPFIPDPIRSMILEYLNSRLGALSKSCHIAFELYEKGLSEGNYWDDLDGNKHWLHNKIMDSLRKEGFGIDDSQAKVNEIRKAIQNYFNSFDTISRT